MATLYTQREKNIRKTWLLMILFFTVIVAIGWVFAQIYQTPVILYGCIIYSLAMNLFSYWYSDKIVLKMYGAKEATHENNRELYHIVENLCIASGLKMPKIYVIEDEALNAFATGRNEENAVIAVTRGIIEKLDRSELEGVIAHELSHIGNRDILLSTIIIVLVGFISVLSELFLRSISRGGEKSSRSKRSTKSNGTNIVMLLIGILFAIMAPIAIKIIQLAISRKREFLADASGALLTRYPEGLASALEKISNDPIPMKQVSKVTSHLLICSPLKESNIINYYLTSSPSFSSVSNLFSMFPIFSTHPPIEERIKALRGLNI